MALDMSSNNLAPEFRLDGFAPSSSSITAQEGSQTQNTELADENAPLFSTAKKKPILKTANFNRLNKQASASFKPFATGNLLLTTNQHVANCRNCLKPLNHRSFSPYDFNASCNSLETLIIESPQAPNNPEEPRQKQLFCSLECEISCLKDEIKAARRLILSSTKNGPTNFSADLSTVQRSILEPRLKRIHQLTQEINSSASSKAKPTITSPSPVKVGENTSISFMSQSRPLNVRQLDKNDDSSVCSSVSSSFYVGSFRENVRKNNKFLSKILNYNFA